MTFTLAPHQQTAHDFVVSRPRAGLFLGIGSGKTLTTLAALQTIRPTGHILIIAPDAIARTTWINEIRKHKIPVRVKNLTYSEQDTKLNPKQRRQAFSTIYTEPATLFIISNNTVLLRQLIEYCRSESKRRKHPNPFPFHTLIIDESQEFKSASSQRFKLLKSVSPFITRLIELTGSPRSNSLEDLWAQAYLLDSGAALGPNITTFRQRYLIPVQYMHGRPVRYKPRPGAEDEIYQSIRHLVMSTDIGNIDLPERLDSFVSTPMPASAQAAYTTLAKELIIAATVPAKNPTESDSLNLQISADSAAAIRARLLQFASGTVYLDQDEDTFSDPGESDSIHTTDAGDREFIISHQAKFTALEHIISVADTPVLVAYRFRSERKAITDYLTAQGYQVETFDGSQDMMHRWNTGTIPVMLLQPASYRHGINIQDGGSHLVWFSLPDSLEAYEQTNGRLHRRGQKQTVTVHHLVTPNTADAIQPTRLQQKADAQDAFLESVTISSIEQLAHDLLGATVTVTD